MILCSWDSYNHTMSSSAKPSLFSTVTGQPSSLPRAHTELNPSVGHLHNNTVYRIEEAVLPLTFARVSTKPRVIATRTVVKILIVSFKVRAANRSPEALTFVPVFLTDEGDVLEPSTCDIVGRYDEGELELNPTFVQKHECGKAKVRNVHVKFDLSAEDLDFSPSMFDGTADPDPTASTVRCLSPVSRKMAAKRPPGKHNPPFGDPFRGRKVPRGGKQPSSFYASRKQQPMSDDEGDDDAELEELINETLGFECDVPTSLDQPPSSPPRLQREQVDPECVVVGDTPAPPQD